MAKRSRDFLLVPLIESEQCGVHYRVFSDNVLPLAYGFVDAPGSYKNDSSVDPKLIFAAKCHGMNNPILVSHESDATMKCRRGLASRIAMLLCHFGRNIRNIADKEGVMVAFVALCATLRAARHEDANLFRHMLNLVQRMAESRCRNFCVKVAESCSR